jgi:hypothetical protein
MTVQPTREVTAPPPSPEQSASESTERAFRAIEREFRELPGSDQVSWTRRLANSMSPDDVLMKCRVSSTRLRDGEWQGNIIKRRVLACFAMNTHGYDWKVAYGNEEVREI